jgi:5-methyltetrahydrofolate--homocysteine methyltransferase
VRQLIIIGELINSTRDEVKEALANREGEIIRKLARDQHEAGADFIDINAATSMEKEVEDTKWLVNIVQEELEGVRLSIDTPNPEAMAKGLELCKEKPMINSITNEKERKKEILPLVKEYEAEVIALAMGSGGMPKSAEDRLTEARELIQTLTDVGVKEERIYIDPLAMSIGSNQDQACIVMDTIRTIKGEYEVKTSVGLSNVSFGLPDRSLINRTFLAILLSHGLDAAIMDPTNNQLMDTVRAAEALLATDKHCMNYIKHKRRS